MAVQQMQKFGICALKTHRQAILDELQALGITELNFSRFKYTKMKYLTTEDTTDQRQVYEKNVQNIERALETLRKYDEAKGSLLDSMFGGKETIGRADYDAVLAKEEELREANIKVNQLSHRIASLQGENQKLASDIEGLKPWMSLDVPMNFSGTKETAFFIGSLPGEQTADTVAQEIAKAEAGFTAYHMEVLFQEKTTTYLAFLCRKNDADRLENALRAIGFARPTTTAGKVPEELAQDYQKKIEENGQAIEEAEAAIKELVPYRKDLEIMADAYRMRADKYEAMGQMPQTKNTFFISGFVPTNAVSLLEKRVVEPYGCHLEVDEIKGDAPVMMKNNWFAQTYEGVLGSYGFPKKGEFDPSMIMAMFYVFFFGMMLSDFGYGLLLTVGGAFILKKFKNMDEGMRKSVRMFFFGGISTMFWGIMYGSYFGDLPDVIAREFMGITLAEGQHIIPPVWFEPIQNPMKLLIFCLLFGLIHLFVGLGIDAYSNLKKGDVKAFLWNDLMWYLLIIGLILMLLPTTIMTSIMSSFIPNGITFPGPVNTLAKVLAIVGALGIILFSGRRAKNPVKRIMIGLYDLYGITSWLSDLLSYSCLLALGMATGIIAQVINMIGTMFGSGILKVIILIVVFVVGSALNLFINTLGAYVHSNRLEFVEFFSKFYEGGGKPFEAFHRETKYINLKED